MSKVFYFSEMSVKQISAFLLIQLICYFRLGTCGKVLVWPTEYSHWINIKIIVDELVQRGHEVTVLTSSASILIDPSSDSSINFEIYPVPVSKEELQYMFQSWVAEWTYDFQKYSFWTYYSKMEEFFSKYSDVIENFCKAIVWNKSLMKKLQESKFDVILADAIGPCGELLAELLKTPLVYSLRFCPGYKFEKYSGGLTLPPSYVPVVLSEFSDHMTFVERVKNMLQMLYFDFWFQTFNEKSWSQFYSEALGRPTTLSEMMGKADIWLIRTYWDLQFPHPLLPNFDFVGGLHCKPAKPLPKEMEDFVQSSGEHGIVVFSLGSVVKNITSEKANIVASALAQIPQKVLWRFDGKKPDTLASNTRLYKWLPQNDLLGHPKTKAFIAHGGTNGIYEAIYHGIPIVGIPLFADQPDNINHMVAKGAAIRVDFSTLSTTELLNALRTVINDPSYKENAMKLSRIQHDQPMKPLDKAVFWIEYVMRNRGAKHLRPALHDLTWFQYHSLDVIGFLLACVAAVVFIITKCCLFCCHKTSNMGKKKKKE
ncbi:UDP-glucuronosyltransferase 2B1 [Arvicola amphibius]|uniref:UDP-glucuronosyltransferase 2B1 n=1 Tax=Arvicola amphibius TaxID=1047088 RepID=UPI0018E38A90|nr:UDP-glucuronosyltransferase 2B1 [Arvicola amphibius]